jgi:hypothetical protein
MANPTRTPGYRAVAKTISEAIENRHTVLRLPWYSSLHLLPPEIAKLVGLEQLVLTRCPIEDLTPIAGLQRLSRLDIQGTRIRDPLPLANLLSLSDAVAREAPTESSILGLSYRNTPFALEHPFSALVELSQPAKTVETINYIRRRAGLAEYFPEGYVRPADLADIEQLEPVSGVPSALGFDLVEERLRLTASAADQPLFPFATSKRDHANRLATCQALAEDLANDLTGRTYNARGEYEQALRKYGERLPRRPGQGNILLSEAAARTLRDMFAADADILPVGLAAALKTLLEQHIGLRVYYPQIEQFYRDVQTGHLQAPLPLDAVQDVVRIVKRTRRECLKGTLARVLRAAWIPLPSQRHQKCCRHAILRSRGHLQIPLARLTPRRLGTTRLPAPSMASGRCFAREKG